MYDFSTSFEMDTLALESAMTIFEYENGITPEYLRSYDDDSDSDFSDASESAGILAGLFEDDFVATEGFSDTKVGKGIKVALITIGGAIKKMFISLATNIKSWFQKQIEKFQRKKAQNNPYYQAVLKVKGVADLRNEVNTVFKTASTVITSASTVIKPMIQRINKALNAAAIGNSKKQTVDADTLAEINRNYDTIAPGAGSHTRNILSSGKNLSSKDKIANSDADISADAESDAVDAIKKLEEQDTKLREIITKINTDMKTILEGNKKGSLEVKGEKTNMKGETSQTTKSKEVTSDMIVSVVLQDVNLAAINSVAKSITTECSVHANACENIVKTAKKLNDETKNQQAKSGYLLCQRYMQCSRIFTRISMACNALFVFKVGNAVDSMKKPDDDDE